MNDRTQRLRDHVNYQHLDGDICLRCWAADEIERLRAAGDALADALRSGGDRQWDTAIDGWVEARRG